MINSERRQFFRATCRAVIELREVDDKALTDNRPHTFFNHGESLDFLSQFHQLDKQAAHLSQSLRAGNQNAPLHNEQKALLDYLDIINRKTSCIAQSIAAQQSISSQQTEKQISLSENGLCFQSQQSFAKSTLVAARLVFLPNYFSVSTFARVVRCDGHDNVDEIDQAGKSDPYHIALEFEQIGEADRQIIAQQVMAAQLNAQREAKKYSN